VQRVIMRSKIHRATMMRAVVDFQGSYATAPEFMRATDLAPGEMVRADEDNRLRVQAAIA
jgi:aspartate 1-decarboxylase